MMNPTKSYQNRSVAASRADRVKRLHLVHGHPMNQRKEYEEVERSGLGKGLQARRSHTSRDPRKNLQNFRMEARNTSKES